MPNVVFPYTLVNGATADADQVMANLIALRDVINGALDAINLANGAVTRTKLATDALNAFTKLATPGDHKEAWGVDDNGGASWGGNPDRVFTIAHGLGAVPTEVQLTGHTAVSTVSGGDPTVCSIQDLDATNILVRQSTLYRGNCNFPGAPVHWRARV